MTFRIRNANGCSHFSTIFAALVLETAAIGFAPPALAVDREQDGIAASVSIIGNELLVGWHFLRPIEVPLSALSATVNLRPIGIPTIEPYPGLDEETIVLLMLDLTDPKREDQINQDKTALFTITGRATTHHQVAFGVYAEKPQLLVPQDRSTDGLVESIIAAQPRDGAANLNLVLREAVNLIAKPQADRRGIYVLSDGHSDDTLDTTALTDLAKRSDVALTFILTASERKVDLTQLAEIAEATGGEVIRPGQRQKFLNAPFDLLDSGATARFPLGEARRYFWEPEADIKVVFHYGDRSLELSFPAPPIPLAGPVETSKYLADTHPIAVAGAGGIIVAFCVAGAALVRRRKAVMPVKPELTATMLRTHEAPQPAVDSGSDKVPFEPPPTAEPRSPQPPAMLEDVENGTTYEVSKPLVQIGRDAANDVVLQDMTVSRFHAVIRSGADGSYSIENQSDTNATRVNYQNIGRARLADGDVIEFGATKLRYRQPARLRIE